jgi:predicted xylose isomerase-like sugar epimerase
MAAEEQFIIGELPPTVAIGPLADHPAAIGLACGAIADAVFPHNNDRDRRQKLALALVDLTRLLTRDDAELVQTLEVRVSGLRRTATRLSLFVRSSSKRCWRR